jgi:hypothetical protein
MRDLAGDMVQNVCLGDTVCSMSTEPSHQLAAVTEKVAVHGSESTTRESKLGWAVVRKQGVGMLEEGDEDEPVVDPKVGNEIGNQDVGETIIVNTSGNAKRPESNTNSGDNDLAVLMWGEHSSVRVEVCIMSKSECDKAS